MRRGWKMLEYLSRSSNRRRQKRGRPRAAWTGGIEKGTKPATRGLGRQKRLESGNRKTQDAMKPAIYLYTSQCIGLNTFGKIPYETARYFQSKSHVALQRYQLAMEKVNGNSPV